MSGSPFGLVRQISSGPDGVRYVGVDHRDHADVQVDRLFLAQRDAVRWRQIAERVAIASYVQHPAVLRARAWQPEGPDPHLVTASVPTSLSARVGSIERDQTVDLVVRVAAALSEAHKLGIAHGQLCPSRIGVDASNNPILDLFHLQTGEVELTAQDHACLQSPNGPSHPQAMDVYGLAMTCVVLLTNRVVEGSRGITSNDDAVTQIADAGSRLSLLLHEMLDADPNARPTMHEVAARLQRADVSQLFTILSPGVESQVESDPDATAVGESVLAELTPGARLGRYDLGEILGEGGMGKVFRATDVADKRVVALKVLHTRWSRDDEALHRFYREARLLAQLQNPHIAQFIDANEVDGVHYLAMEFVEGKTLHDVLEAEARLSVELALSVTRDVALALADVHDLGIIHRDIKPANILLMGTGDARRAKLCDFGIAREVATDQELTRAGLTVGTPHYMSPEQCVGGEVTASSDIYALGITLFKMLAGYVPFNARDAQAIVYKHLAEPVPDIRNIAPETTEGAARVLRRMLEKLPESRIADARKLLEELEPVRSGEKTSIAAHPRLPGDAADIISYDFEWRLTSAPVELWPHVSHTERLNRAIGLGAIDFTRKVDADGAVSTFGKLKMSGMTLDWQEHPYEWVAPTRMGVLREFSAGPFMWLRSSVELVPHGNGTLLRHQIQVQPRGMIGKAAAAMEVGFKARKNLEAIYRRIDEALESQRLASSRRVIDNPASHTFTDPFEDPPRLTRNVELRIDALESELSRHVDPRIAEKLCDLVRRAPPQEIARIRPRAFAARHKLDHRDVLRGCLHGAKLGLLVMLWDVICPRCRIPSDILESLEALREHAHCDACALDFELDFARSVEIIFRADPGLRDTEVGTFCIGGPGHTPHVIMQIRLAPHERFEVDLMLDEGHYSVAGRQLPMTWGFTVRRGAALREWELSVRDGPRESSGIAGSAFSSSASNGQTQVMTAASTRTPPPAFAAAPNRVIDAGRQHIVLCNDTDQEVVARIEREGERADAVTAAEAAATAAFRELFPSEILSPGHLISIGRVTLLVADANVWSSHDEAEAFARLTDLSRLVTEHVDAAGGAVVKIHGDGIMAAFAVPADATRAALTLVDERISELRVAVHTGAAMATSINDRLDYFGRLIRQAEELLHGIEPGRAAVSETTYADPEVGELLARVPGPMGLLATQEVIGQVVSSSAHRPPTTKP